jgi:UDP-2,3-diacylglucosamine pyrophosphatase LpxH
LNRNKAAATSAVVVADNELEESVKVVYLDNCCQVNASIKAIFGAGVCVKLDVFHWLKRWNDIMYDSKAAHAGIFQGLMSRAVFNAEADEFERAKEKLLL